MADLVGSEMGIVMLIASVEGGEWIFFVASGVAIVGACGLFFRKPWGRVISMLALGLFGLIKLSMAVLSSEQAQSRFSFSEHPTWLVATEAVLLFTALGWLFSPLAQREFQANEK